MAGVQAPNRAHAGEQGAPMIAIQPQFSIFLDNRPGMLARTCQALAKDGVNILALSVAESMDHAVIRLVLSDAVKGAETLKSMHGTVHQRDVIVMDLPNRPGILAEIAQRLTGAGINIEYAYCASTGAHATGAIVLRTNDLEATLNILG